MKKSPESLVLEFFRDRYGTILTDFLYKQTMRKIGINDFNALPKNDQITKGQEVIESVYKNFYAEDRIKNLKVLYVVRYALNETIENFEKVLKTEAEVQLGSFEIINQAKTADIVAALADEKMFNFGFSISGILQGTLLCSMEVLKVVTLAQELLKRMKGTDINDTKIDETKISVIYEMFKVIYPDFMSVITDIYKQKIDYKPLTFEEFQKQNIKEGALVAKGPMFESKVLITIGQIHVESKMYILIDAAQAQPQAAAAAGTAQNDPLEQSPPQLLMKRTGNIRADVEAFFTKLGLKALDLDALCKKIKIADIAKCDYHTMIKFHQGLIADYFSTASANKKEAIKKNLSNLILGV